MGLETTVNYISDLNIDWPAPNDPKSAGDDHIRYAKKAMKQSFPLVAGPVPIAHDQFASKTYVDNKAFQTALPAQPGGAVVYKLTSQGATATWRQDDIYSNPVTIAQVCALALALN